MAPPHALQAQVDYENSVSRLNKVKQQSKVDVKKYNQAVAEMTQVWTRRDHGPSSVDGG